MTEEIDRQILHKYDIESKLGKGVRLRQQHQSAARSDMGSEDSVHPAVVDT